MAVEAVVASEAVIEEDSEAAEVASVVEEVCLIICSHLQITYNFHDILYKLFINHILSLGFDQGPPEQVVEVAQF